MPDLVFASDIAVGGLGGDDLAHARFDTLLVFSECQEDGAYICRLYISQFCPIVLFLFEGELVSLDAVLLVVIDRGEPDEAELRVVTHRLLIDVHAIFGVLYKVSLLDEMLQVGSTCRVHFVSVRIGLGIECDLWLVDVEEAHGVAVRHSTCLLGVEGIVGW